MPRIRTVCKKMIVSGLGSANSRGKLRPDQKRVGSPKTTEDRRGMAIESSDIKLEMPTRSRGHPTGLAGRIVQVTSLRKCIRLARKPAGQKQTTSAVTLGTQRVEGERPDVKESYSGETFSDSRRRRTNWIVREPRAFFIGDAHRGVETPSIASGGDVCK